MSRTATAAVLTALALSVSACGGNADAQASKAISDSIMKSQRSASATSQFLAMKRRDADCIGKGLVDRIGADQLRKYGLLTKDNKAKAGLAQAKMSAGDAKAATGVLFGCVDVTAMMRSAITNTSSISGAMRSCVTKALGEKSLRDLFTKVFQGDQAGAQKQLTGPLTRCALGNQ